MNNEQKKASKSNLLIAYCLLFVALLPLLWNLLRPGFYTSDDGEWMVIRLTAFHQSVREGQFPVRWLKRLNHEYGYPVMNFLYPLPFYFAEPLYAVTKNPVFAIKTVMGAAIVSMAFGMYVLMKSKGVIPAFTATTVYMYAPYVAFNLYQRGSFGEIVAMGFVPWVFWAIRKKQFPLASLLIASLILSHNVVAVLFFPFILLYAAFQSFQTLEPIRYVALMTLALGLSAFFWFPALTELKYVRASQISVADFQDEYLPLSDALERVGIIQSALTLGFPLYFTSQSASWFWDGIPNLKIIQFPWRIFSLFTFASSVIIGIIVWNLRSNKNLQYIFVTLITPLTIYSSWKFLTPKSFINRPSSYYETNDDSTTVRAEYTPIWVFQLPKKRPDIPTQHYYPGWKAFWEGEEVSLVDPQETAGLLKAKTRISNSPVIFRWWETLSRTIANLTSAISFLILLFWHQRLSLMK